MEPECTYRAHLFPDPNYVQELGAWSAAPQGPLQPLVLLLVSGSAQKLLGYCRSLSPSGRAIATTCGSRHRSAYMPHSRGHTDAVQVGHKTVPEQIAQDIVSKHWEVPGTLQSN